MADPLSQYERQQALLSKIDTGLQYQVAFPNVGDGGSNRALRWWI